MSIKQKQRELKKFETENEISAPVLWKKVNQRGKESTSTSLQKKRTQTISYTQSKTDYNQNINEFLAKVQKKISQSKVSSQSQILQKISIDWPQQNPNNSKISRYISFDSPCKTDRVLCYNCDQLAQLKQIKSIEQLKLYIKPINPIIYSELKNLISQLQILTSQKTMLSQQELKNKQIIINMSKYIKNLQTKNSCLINDLNNLNNQVQKQIKLQEEKIKYEYQKIIQDMKIEMQRKYDKDSSSKADSTKYTGSIEQLTKSISFNFDVSLSNNDIGQKNKKSQQKQKIATIKQKNDNRLNLGNNKEQNFQRVVFDIIKPYRRQNRSLKLPSNIN